MQLSFKRAFFGALAPLLAIIAACAGAPANAGDVDRAADPAAVARQARCDNFGQGSTELTDSDGCVRIRGYIAAGDRFAPDEPAGGPAAPFVPLDAPGIVASVPALGETTINVAPNPDQIFMPASQGDSAR